jgi:hypothetical protein
MDNPFRYGQVATGEHFTDRTRELASLVTDASSGQSVVIISPRRFGKTSLAIRAEKSWHTARSWSRTRICSARRHGSD